MYERLSNHCNYSSYLNIKVKICFFRFSDLSADLSADLSTDLSTEALAQVEALAKVDHGHTFLLENLDLSFTHKIIFTHWTTKIRPAVFFPEVKQTYLFE
jgi:hypothetical protein